MPVISVLGTRVLLVMFVLLSSVIRHEDASHRSLVTHLDRHSASGGSGQSQRSPTDCGMAHMPLHSGPPATRSGPSMRGAASAAARVSAGGDITHGHVDAHGTSRQRGQRVPIHPLTFGHVALALVPGAGAGAPLKQTLLALRGGVHL